MADKTWLYEDDDPTQMTAKVGRAGMMGNGVKLRKVFAAAKNGPLVAGMMAADEILGAKDANAEDEEGKVGIKRKQTKEEDDEAVKEYRSKRKTEKDHEEEQAAAEQSYRAYRKLKE